MNKENLRKSFYKEWDSDGAYFAKSLLADLPTWEDIVNILNSATRKDAAVNNCMHPVEFEIAYKDIYAIKKLSYSKEDSSNFKIESDATFFFSLFFSDYDRSKILSESANKQLLEINNIFDIDANFNSLKISLSDKFVPYEKHDWHTCIIQLQGISKWELKDDTRDFEKTYILERGDVLFFKEHVYHQVTNDGPRSSIVGRFTVNNEVQNA